MDHVNIEIPWERGVKAMEFSNGDFPHPTHPTSKISAACASSPSPGSARKLWTIGASEWSGAPARGIHPGAPGVAVATVKWAK